MKHEKTKKLCVLAMLCALAYVMVAVVRIPVVLFLKYEPKDVVIAFAGFLYGPLAAVAVSAVVSLIEMLTISDTGLIGFVMNVLSSVAFAGTAALVYRKKHTLSGAIAGLAAGTLGTTAVMLLWNYALTPLYMGYARADVAKMLLPYFLPFNLLKGTLNSAITLLLYRPLVSGLRQARLFPQSTAVRTPSLWSRLLLWIGAAMVIAVCVAVILLLR